MRLFLRGLFSRRKSSKENSSKVREFSLKDIIELDKVLSVQGELSKKRHLVRRFEEEKGLKFIVKNGKWLELSLLPNLKIRKEMNGMATLYMRDELLREVVLIRVPLQAFFNEYALQKEVVEKTRRVGE